MRKMKSLTVLVLSFVMLATMCAMPVVANAAETNVATYEATEADRILVEKLEAFGAITDVEADVTSKVTRRQMAELITDYMRVPASSQTQSPFVDVTAKDESIGAIVALYDLKIITGDDSFHFHPDANLTYDEALVFMINAIGYKMFATRDGGYPTGYHRVAIKLGMLKDLLMNLGKDEVILRDVYKLMEAGFKAPAVVTGEYTAEEASYLVSSTEDYLLHTYGISTHKGIITGSEDTRLTSATSTMTDEQIEINNTLYDTPGYIYATSLGRSVDYYLRDDGTGEKEIAYIEESKTLNNLTKVNAEDILVSKSTNNRIYYEDEEFKEHHINFTNAVDVIYNGRCYRGYGNLLNVLPEAGYIEALDNTGDSVADVLFVYAYRNIVIETVDAYNSVITAKLMPGQSTNERISFDMAEGNAKAFSYPANNPITSVDRIAAGNVASVLESKGTPKLTTLYVCNETVTGTIQEVSAEYGYKINEEYYQLADDFFGLELRAGVSGKFRLDMNGKIAYAQYDSSTSTGSAYAVVTGIEYNSNGIVDEISMRLFTQDKQFVIAPLAEKIKINDVPYVANGTNADTIMSQFATKNEETGAYVIDSAYVISYTMTDGEISKIYLPEAAGTTEKGTFALIADDILELIPRSSGMYIRKTDDTLLFPSYASGNAVVFVAPANGEMTQMDDYDVLEKLTERHYINSTSSSQYYIITESSAVYTANTAEVPTVNVVLLRGAKISGSSGASSSNNIQVITDFTTAVDSEGMSRKKIYFGSNGSMLADKVTLEMDGETHYDLSPNSDLINSLQPGYVVLCSYDDDNKIEKISVQAKYVNGELISNLTVTAGNIGKEEGKDSTFSGTVSVMDIPNNALTVSIDGVDGLQIVVKTDTSSMVNVFRAGTNKITSDTLSSISTGDRVIIRLKNFFVIDSLITFR